MILDAVGEGSDVERRRVGEPAVLGIERGEGLLYRGERDGLDLVRRQEAVETVKPGSTDLVEAVVMAWDMWHSAAASMSTPRERVVTSKFGLTDVVPSS